MHFYILLSACIYSGGYSYVIHSAHYSWSGGVESWVYYTHTVDVH